MSLYDAPEVHILTILTLVLALFLPAAASDNTQPNILLISMDTTRADALSCYGSPPDIPRALPPTTPVLDGIAARGSRFTSFYAHAPTTLSSHASMLTGLDPHAHGVVRNGFPLSPDLDTLPEALQRAGYRTIGIIGSSALSADMGLSQGFDVYDDRLTERQSIQYEDRAEHVVHRTIQALSTATTTQPTFLFVHFFDPHGPFSAPQPFTDRWVDPDYSGRFAGSGFVRRQAVRALRNGDLTSADRDYIASRYLAEVSYVDAEIGRLLAYLDAQGFLQHAVVIVTADHGETLSEHPKHAWSHGFDVDTGATRVPLIIAPFGMSLGIDRVVRRTYGMRDLAPAIARIAKLSWAQERAHLWQALRAGPVWDREGWPSHPTHLVLQEATAPRKDDPVHGWNNLDNRRGIRLGEHVGTARNTGAPLRMLQGDAAFGPLLRRLLGEWDRSAPPYRAPNMRPDTERALEALGYMQPQPGGTLGTVDEEK